MMRADRATETRRDRSESAAVRGGQPPKDAEAGADLVSTIEDQIIPRLLLAHDGDREAPGGCGDTRPPPTAEEIDGFAALSVEHDVAGLLEEVARLSREGLSFETLLLDLIGGAADHIGVLWQDDVLTFGQVTVAAGALQRVSAALGHQAESMLRHGDLVVLTTPPGEQHVLPLHLLGELLQQEGWAAHVEPNLDEEDLIDLVSEESVVTVAISCKSPERLDRFETVVRKVTGASLNPDLEFVFGGTDELRDVAARCGGVYCPTLPEMLTWLADHKQVLPSS